MPVDSRNRSRSLFHCFIYNPAWFKIQIMGKQQLISKECFSAELWPLFLSLNDEESTPNFHSKMIIKKLLHSNRQTEKADCLFDKAFCLRITGRWVASKRFRSIWKCSVAVPQMLLAVVSGWKYRRALVRYYQMKTGVLVKRFYRFITVNGSVEPILAEKCRQKI